MGRRGAAELYRAPFPLYTVSVPRADLVVTAGGGGASKTGISNGVHFLRLERVTGSLSAMLLHSHDTETRAPMNMAVAGDILAIGQDSTCHILRIHEEKQKPVEQKNSKKEETVKKMETKKRRQATKTLSNASGDMRNESSEIVVEPLHVVHTDFSSDALQKSVRFNQEHSILVTGGVDGCIRLWEFPSMKKRFDFQAHEGEIEDLDISPDNKIVTVGRDFKCCVWKNDQLVTELCWNENMPQITDKMYRYQACRFGKVEDNQEALRLYTVQIPHKRERKPLQCYISKWDGNNFLPLLTRPCGNEVISAMTVSDLGTFIGLGTVTGSVAIYIAFSLQQVYYMRETHGIVVTDLAFLPDVRQAREMTGESEAALLSVAVDSRCKLHLVPSRQLFPVWVVMLLCGLIIVLTIVLLQHLFPGLL
ncbi:prolactin regulatory element-binding protein [Hypanus sabinus]|uniref:prolactin regulatory element-binding protein n=1 Tax=Hypanus sabinus TaxID=79690 RepID=UPI0028C3E300|nr:prolactin regulatory element-binding protein [Hypanus sabinus]